MLCYRQSLSRLSCLINEESVVPDASPARSALGRKKLLTSSRSTSALDSLSLVKPESLESGGLGRATSRHDAAAVAAALASIELDGGSAVGGATGGWGETGPTTSALHARKAANSAGDITTLFWQ